MLRSVPAVGAVMAHITINQYLQQVTLVTPRRALSGGSSLFCFGLPDLGMRWAAVFVWLESDWTLPVLLSLFADCTRAPAASWKARMLRQTRYRVCWGPRDAQMVAALSLGTCVYEVGGASLVLADAEGPVNHAKEWGFGSCVPNEGPS